MKSKKNILSFFIVILFSQQLYAQDSTLLQQNEKTSFTIGTSFASKLHYFGRTDSLKSTALIPNISLQFGEGFFINASAILINNNIQSLEYAATVAGGGFRFGKPKGIAGSIYADKFFYANNTLVQSSQKGQAGFTLSHLNKIVNVNIAGSTVFSDKSDYFASAGIDHPIRIESGKSVWVIVPSFTANAGTQNFTKIYYKTRNVFGLPAGEERVTESSKRFQLLSYELSLPVVFVYNRLSISFIPGYVLPQNIIKVDGRPDLSENASNLFYANLGVAFKFGGK